MKKLMFALVVASAVGSASAQQSYVGAGIVGASQNYSFSVAGPKIQSDDTKAATKLFFGYDFNQTWGLETGFTFFGSTGYHYNYLGQEYRGETTARSMYVAAKVTFPITDQFSFVGKLGISGNKRSLHDAIFDLDETKHGLYSSIGVQYLLNDKVSVNLDYEQYDRRRHQPGLTAKAFSLSAKYAF